jgi:hypothetical protein
MLKTEKKKKKVSKSSIEKKLDTLWSEAVKIIDIKIMV